MFDKHLTIFNQRAAVGLSHPMTGGQPARRARPTAPAGGIRFDQRAAWTRRGRDGEGAAFDSFHRRRLRLPRRASRRPSPAPPRRRPPSPPTPPSSSRHSSLTLPSLPSAAAGPPSAAGAGSSSKASAVLRDRRAGPGRLSHRRAERDAERGEEVCAGGRSGLTESGGGVSVWGWGGGGWVGYGPVAQGRPEVKGLPAAGSQNMQPFDHQPRADRPALIGSGLTVRLTSAGQTGQFKLVKRAVPSARDPPGRAPGHAASHVDDGRYKTPATEAAPLYNALQSKRCPFTIRAGI
jgi:hypothetical protein